MNDLTNLPPSSSLAKPTTFALSGGLKSLLEVEASTDRAVAEIAASPVMLAEARQALPALKARASQQAGSLGVQRALAKQFAVYPQPERTEGEWADFWALYVGALSDLPEGAINAALIVWVRKPDSQFLPKPGELRALAMATENRDVRSYERARRAVEYVPPKAYDNHHAPNVLPRIMRQEPTQADKERVKAWAADFARQVPEAAPISFPASHGPVDEKGLTQAMRDAINRGKDAR